MKKGFITRVLPAVLFLTCLVFTLVLAACSSSNSSSSDDAVPEEPKFAVQVFVDCNKNLIFSRYDVDVKVDGEKIGNVEHGSDATFEMSLTKGQHELVFKKEGASEPDGKTSFVVEDEGDKFSFRISCTSEQIEIKSINEDVENRLDSEQDKSETKEDALDTENQKVSEDEAAKQEQLVQDLKNCEGKTAEEGLALAVKAGYHYDFLDVNRHDVTSKIEASSSEFDEVRKSEITYVDVYEGFADGVIFTLDYEDLEAKEEMEQIEREAAGEFYFLKGKTAIEARDYINENHPDDVVPMFYYTVEGLFAPKDIDFSYEVRFDSSYEKSASEAIVIRVLYEPHGGNKNHVVKFYIDRRIEEE